MPYSPAALVVDDERFVADTLVLVLQKAGYSAIACYSAENAIPLMSGLAFNVVLSDVILGKLSGIDVAIAARKLIPRCRVLLISGNPATQELLDSANMGGHDLTCLAKPIHPDELLAQLAAEDNGGPEAPQPKADAD